MRFPARLIRRTAGGASQYPDTLSPRSIAPLLQVNQRESAAFLQVAAKKTGVGRTAEGALQYPDPFEKRNRNSFTV